MDQPGDASSALLLDVPSEPHHSSTIRFIAAPYPLLRVNLTAAASLRAARAGTDAQLLEKLRELVAEQQAAAVDLSDALYAAAVEVDHELRNSLVLPIRRAVHNGRLPLKPLNLDAVATLGCAAELNAWLRRQREVEGLRDLLVRGYDEALDEERHQLRDVLKSGPLLRSLGLSSEFLPNAALRYASQPWAELPKKTRKSEGSLLRYAVRAGSKTSPYSQYTAVAFLDEEEVAPGPLRTESSVEVNRAVLRRVESALLRAPTAGEHINLHASVGLRHQDEVLVAHGDRDQLGAQAARVAERYGEAQVTSPASPAVLALLRWLGQQESGSATLGELTGLIATNVPGADLDSARTFVLTLVDHGVLAASPIVDDQAANTLETLSIWLAENAPLETGKDLRHRILGLAASARGFADAAPLARVELIRTGRRQRDEILRSLGDDVDKRPGPEPVWYEDCRLLGGAPGKVSDWSVVLDDCRDLLGILSIFDEQHIFSRVLTHRFVERFGHGGTTSELDAMGEIFMPAYGDALQLTEGLDHELIHSDPVIGEIIGIRERILTPLVEQLRQHRADGGPVELGREWIDSVADQSPAWVRQTPSSHSVFLQPLGGNPPNGAVLNKIYNGWGNYLSRFLTAAPAHVVDAVRSNSRQHLPSEDVVAELRPVQGFNANIHPLLGDVDLDFDGRGTAHSLPMHRLALRHNSSTERVELWDTGTRLRVHPFYLGFLIPYYLPSHLVPLTAMAGSGSVMFEPQVSADRGSSVDRAVVRHYPRVTFASLVLARARWYVPAAMLPRSTPGDTEADFFLRLNEWRISHGIPEQVFVHPPAPELEPGKVNDYFGSYMTNRKPQYLALLSRLHVRHLQRLLVQQPGADIVFEEALPDRENAFPLADSLHATELIAEFYRPAFPEPREKSRS